MNTEAQRIAIAEACGYRYLLDDTRPGPDLHNFVPPGVEDVDSEEAGIWHMDFGYAVRALPDYLGDLNAMHEAEKLLTWEQAEEYTLLLTTATIDDPMPMIFGSTHATAAQRAEAFLRTLNLWTE